MIFNFKESINKIKQTKIKYAIEEDNLRLQKGFQNKFDESIYNFNKISKSVDNKALMSLNKINVPVVESGNYVLSTNSPLEINFQDKNVEYIQNNINN
jgi:tetrahydrodipicolinate N-succinyltransferase